MNVDLPIAVYCVCPEERTCRRRPADVDLLQAHGYGLITVDRDHMRPGDSPASR